jgi:WASH complex subunit strumpellin
MIRKLVQAKAQIWNEDRETCYDFIDEVAEFFAGNRDWGKGHADKDFTSKQYQNLTGWFKDVAERISALDYKKSNKTGVKIQNLVQALEDVQAFEGMEQSVQIKHNI